MAEFIVYPAIDLRFGKVVRLKQGRGDKENVSMKKTIGMLIDELSITNCKIFALVDKVQKNEHTKKDAKKIQDLNSYRSQLTNAINEYFKERQDIKV